MLYLFGGGNILKSLIFFQTIKIIITTYLKHEQEQKELSCRVSSTMIKS